MASIRKRKWQTKSGEMKSAYECSYVDLSGKRRRKQFERKKEAETFLLKARSEVNQGMHTPEGESVTLMEAAKLWLKKSQLNQLEISTIRQYETFVNLHLIPYIGKTKLPKLSTPLVQKYINQISEKVSLNRARICRNHLSSIISYCQKLGLIAFNPVLPIRLRLSKRHKKPVQIPSKMELNLMLEKSSDRFLPLLTVAIFTGMRSSELLGLTWDKVNFENRMIEVSQRLERITGRIGSPKSKAGYRFIPMANRVYEILKSWKEQCPEGELNLVFPNLKGGIYRHTNLIKHQWKPLQKKCGLVNEHGSHLYKFHSLRHAAASLFIESGFNLKHLQTIIGHENISLTIGTYGHLMEESKPSVEMMRSVEDKFLCHSELDSESIKFPKKDGSRVKPGMT